MFGWFGLVGRRVGRGVGVLLVGCVVLKPSSCFSSKANPFLWEDHTLLTEVSFFERLRRRK